MPFWRTRKRVTPAGSSTDTSTPHSRQDYEGKLGKLIVAIPEGRTGVVRLQDATGATVQETAVSLDGSAIPNETWVLIIQVRKYDVLVVLSPVQLEEGEETW